MSSPASATSSAPSFLSQLESEFENAWAEAKNLAGEAITEVETVATAMLDKIISVGASLALNAVMGQWGLNIPGLEKFGQAVTWVIQQLEITLGADVTNSIPALLQQVHALVQNAYNWVIGKLGLKAQPAGTPAPA